jgi:predicted DNA-binding transcriptional regulator YafY
MDALRRHRRPVTAAALADELSVSVRTICRDVQSLVGLGYLLREGFFLPSLMFDEDEVESLVLGARFPQSNDLRRLRPRQEHDLAADLFGIDVLVSRVGLGQR